MYRVRAFYFSQQTGTAHTSHNSTFRKLPDAIGDFSDLIDRFNAAPDASLQMTSDRTARISYSNGDWFDAEMDEMS